MPEREATEDRLPDDPCDPVRWSCGTGRQPTIIIKQCGSEDPQSEPEDKQHIVCGPQEYDPDKVEPRPCGYQGQSLPGMGADDTKGEEEAEKSKEGEVEKQELPSEIEKVAEVPAEKEDQEISGQEGAAEEDKTEQSNDTVVTGLGAKLGGVLVKIAGRGESRGRHEPKDFVEELALYEVMSNPDNGYHIKGIKITDSRWPAEEGWQKMQQIVEVETPVELEEGKKYPKPGEKYEIVIHYVYNPRLGLCDDFKFKN